jgi:hypothetical protein
MGLVGFIVGLPLAPVRGVIALGRLIQERVDTELHDPASLRRTLEEAEEARDAGEITAEEEAETQRRVLDRAVQPKRPDTGEE